MNQLNDNKAGMTGLDKDRINAIIQESTGKQFDVGVKRKEKRIAERVELQRRIVERLTEEQKATSLRQMDLFIAGVERERDLGRTALHVDMDAFYASVEMRDNPDLRNVPMAVGGQNMLSTSNYLARRFGVRAATPGFIAHKLCPNLTIVPVAMEKYGRAATKVREVLADYDPCFASAGMDEAYLDITQHVAVVEAEVEERVHTRHRYSGDCPCWLPRLTPNADAPQGVRQRPPTLTIVNDDAVDGTTTDAISSSTCAKCGKQSTKHTDRVTFERSAYGVGEEMRFRIEQRTGLTASCGIAANGQLAKICSDMNKPNSQFLLENDVDAIRRFMADLPIHGIGAVSGALLDALGVKVGGDLLARRSLLTHVYSAGTAHFLIRAALGAPEIDDDAANSTSDRKSISVSRTFSALTAEPPMAAMCDQLCTMLAKDVRAKAMKGRTVTLVIKTSDFVMRTRAHSVTEATIHTQEQLVRIARLLLKEELHANNHKLSVRLLGVRLSNLASATAVGIGQAKTTATLTQFVKPIAEIAKRPKMADDPSTSADGDQEIEEIAADATPTHDNENDANAQATTSHTKSDDLPSNFACPICARRWPYVIDAARATQHIDACLNRKTILECVQEENRRTDGSGTRELSTTQHRGKRKSQSTQHTTMDKFVRRGGGA